LTLDLDLDDAQHAIRDALAAFCRDRYPDAVAKERAGALLPELWRGLAELGVLALASPENEAEGEGGAGEMVAALEALGAAVFPGPLAATFLATQLLPEDERRAVAAGHAVVSVGTPPLLPFAPVAQLFLAVDGDRVYRAAPRGPVEPVDVLGGEPWGRVELQRGEELGPATRALALADVARAAWLAAAASRLVEDTAEHARTRRQFGRALGEFQAVAHPLAECHVRAASAGTLARAAAFHLDTGADAGADTRADTRADAEPEARHAAAAARLAAEDAALRAAHVCHQLFGAIGITLEGPVFHVSRRLRQLVSAPPGPGHDALLRPYGL